MPQRVMTITNDHWQVGVLPETGASLAYGRVRLGDAFVDVMRPTAESDYGNASLCASFIMLPWANRLREARFRFRGEVFSLEATGADGTAIHGAVRRLPWRVDSGHETGVSMTFDSAWHDKVNYPFKFSARAEYRLEGPDFVWSLRLRNEDKRAIPVGFGHHPYFLRQPGGINNRVQLEIPFDEQYALVHEMPIAAPGTITPVADYRTLRALDDAFHDDLLTARQGRQPIRIVYPEWKLELHLLADAVYSHALLFAPLDRPFFALEPQTNANDGFNLLDQGINAAGVIVLEPGETVEGDCCLRII